MSSESERFNIKYVKEKFQEALLDDEDVKLQEYLNSFEELNKFFTLMGTLFSFVSSDLEAKINLLKELLEKSNEFKSAKEMINYEKENKLLDKKGYISGARTLLRLHRGLDFIRLFLKKVGEIDNTETTSKICKEAYEQTLAKHHPFLIRNGAKVAIYTLPTKDVLLTRVCGEPESIQEALELLPDTLDVTSLVYERIENLYTLHDLHQLP